MLKQELTSDSHVSINDWANTEWNRCMALRGTFENHAVTYLMTANGGGAATVIAFAGAARYLAPLVLWSLGLFLSGLILSGIGIAIALSRMSWLSNTLSNDQKQFNENKLPVSDLFDNHSKRFKRKFLVHQSGISHSYVSLPGQ